MKHTTLLTLPRQTAKPDLLGNQEIACDLLVHITRSAFLANCKMLGLEQAVKPGLL